MIHQWNRYGISKSTYKNGLNINVKIDINTKTGIKKHAEFPEPPSQTTQNKNKTASHCDYLT